MKSTLSNSIFIAAFALAIITFVLRNHTLDVHIQDTYFVLTWPMVGGFFIAVLSLAGFALQYMQKFVPHRYLIWHPVLTIGSIIVLFCLFYYSNQTMRSLTESPSSFDNLFLMQRLIQLFLIVFVSLQLLLVVGLVTTLFRNY